MLHSCCIDQLGTAEMIRFNFDSITDQYELSCNIGWASCLLKGCSPAEAVVAWTLTRTVLTCIQDFLQSCDDSNWGSFLI